MKIHRLLTLICSFSLPGTLVGQNTGFSYQGRLTAGGTVANGLYEMSFTLYDGVTNGNVVGAPLAVAPVPVTNGLFAVTLDFGAAAFTGADRWLEMTVTPFGSDQPPVTLHPRQPITPTPYALHAYNAAGLMTFNNAPLDIKVNGERVLRLEITGDGPNIIGGASVNGVAPGVVGATISGGGTSSPGFEATNRVEANFGAIGGGAANTIQNLSRNSTISGGWQNTIHADSGWSTIGGGESNTIEPNARYSTISGGGVNKAAGYASVIGGGSLNTVQTNAEHSSIGGGLRNQIAANAMHSTIAGGNANRIDLTSLFSTIGGGVSNWVDAYLNSATIGGGTGNAIHQSADHAAIAGGAQNGVSTLAAFSSIGGGHLNVVGFDAPYSVIGGGRSNIIESESPYTVINGGNGNWIRSNCENSTIGGGNENLVWQWDATIGGGQHNTANGWRATIAGGASNRCEGFAATIGGGVANLSGAPDTLNYFGDFATVAGGMGNQALRHLATVGGGGNNVASNDLATVSGGADNRATGPGSTVGGGGLNAALGTNSTVGGGSYNLAHGQQATVPGGWSNTADGDYSFAAGTGAQANHTGSFVWSDASFGTPLVSSTNNQFTVRAAGGVRFFTDTNATTGAELAPGGGSWSMLSDRSAKENFTAVDSRYILDKVAALPLASWNYKAQDKSVRHLGPMAQDFHAAFGLGEGERTITTVDADGVALAAIQGLNAKLETELKVKDARIADLEHRLAAIEKLLAGRQRE